MATATSARTDGPVDSVGGLSPVRGVLRALGPRLRPFWITAAAMWVVFNAFRVGLLLHSRSYVEDVGPKTVTKCLLLGMRYDAMPMGYMLLPLAIGLLAAPTRIFSHRRFRRAITIYGTAAITLVVFIEIVGAAFFLHYSLRLNCIALNYLDRPLEVGGHIWKNYPVPLAVFGIVVACWGAYRLFGRFYWSRRDGGRGVSASARRAAGRAARLRRGLIRAAAAAVLVAACVLAGRGGADSHPLRRGKAYFSTNKVVSQLTMNNFYTFFYAARANLDDGREDSGVGPLPEFAEAERITAELLFQGDDVPIGVNGNPLWRRTETRRPMLDYNVVVIVMEGMSGRLCGALGHPSPQTPVLDALCEEGLFFERMYAVGACTSCGLTGVLCGHPDLGGKSILKRRSARGRFLTLPAIFRKRGYRTAFLYGGDPSFDEMEEFFSNGGVDKVLGRRLPERTPEHLRKDHWGVHDEVLLHTAHETFLSMSAGDGPFFAIVLTLSNHESYDVPARRVEMLPTTSVENKRTNAYRYADWALGEFFREAREAEYFRRTIFVLVADHGHGFDNRRIIDVPGFRVPCLFYAPGLPEVVPVRRVATVCTQTDIPPTLLSLLGGSYEHCFLGRNVLDVPAGEGFALLHDDDRLAVVRGDRALILPPRDREGGKAILYHTDGFTMDRIPDDRVDKADMRRLQQQMLSYYAMAWHLWRDGAYRPPGR